VRSKASPYQSKATVLAIVVFVTSFLLLVGCVVSSCSAFACQLHTTALSQASHEFPSRQQHCDTRQLTHVLNTQDDEGPNFFILIAAKVNMMPHVATAAIALFAALPVGASACINL
jgi:hypothetical protein